MVKRIRRKKKVYLGKSLKDVQIVKTKPRGAVKHQDTKNIKFYMYKGKEIAVPRRGVKLVRK